MVPCDFVSLFFITSRNIFFGAFLPRKSEKVKSLKRFY